MVGLVDDQTGRQHLFWAGEISSAGRTTTFERRYATLEDTFGRAKVPPVQPATLSAEEEQTAYLHLIRLAARAGGVSTETDLRDYFRTDPAKTREAIGRLVAAGELEPVAVEGWRRPAYLAAGTRVPRAVDAVGLLSPFDSLVWHRDRTETLFDFRFRIEIYVPAHKRVHGYYVLPFLFGDRLVARCDLKADRAAGVLICRAVHWEPDAPAAARPELVTELHRMATWLSLGAVQLPRD